MRYRKIAIAALVIVAVIASEIIFANFTYLKQHGSRIKHEKASDPITAENGIVTDIPWDKDGVIEQVDIWFDDFYAPSGAVLKVYITQNGQKVFSYKMRNASELEDGGNLKFKDLHLNAKAGDELKIYLTSPDADAKDRIKVKMETSRGSEGTLVYNSVTGETHESKGKLCLYVFEKAPLAEELVQNMYGIMPPAFIYVIVGLAAGFTALAIAIMVIEPEKSRDNATKSA